MSDTTALLDRLRSPERRVQVAALARLITIVESTGVARTREILSLLGTDHRSHLVGITGPPGAGKSTITNAVALELRRQGRSVAILAIDPSSPFSHGALLGDRIRLQEHSLDAEVFMRSLSSRGQLGGLAPATLSAALLCEAARFDTVVIETVGIGQSEIDIASVADTTVVALAPGMGDGVQAEKAGILEVADVFVVNKSDRPGAGQLVSELQRMLSLGAPPVPGTADRVPWSVPVVRTTAVREEGFEELVSVLDAHAAAVGVRDVHATRSSARMRFFVREIATALVRESFEEWVQQADGSAAGREPDPYLEAVAVLERAGSLVGEAGPVANTLIS